MSINKLQSQLLDFMIKIEINKQYENVVSFYNTELPTKDETSETNIQNLFCLAFFILGKL